MDRLNKEEKAAYQRALDDYEKEVTRRIKEIRGVIARGGYSGGEAFESRMWLESFTKKGRGIDVCSGSWPIGGEGGVDSGGFNPPIGTGVLGPMDYIRTDGDDLTALRYKEIDYVVSNYLEAFPNTLATLTRWHQILLPGGVIALTVSDADTYTNPGGPLAGKHKTACFTAKTLRCYLEEAGFKDIEITKVGTVLRASGKKP
jgi:hypothetical protein